MVRKAPYDELNGNQEVQRRWGIGLDVFLWKEYPKYNADTKVQILAVSNAYRHVAIPQYNPTVYYNPNDDIPPYVEVSTVTIEFKMVIEGESRMKIAYSPELDTLFVRQLFETTPQDYQSSEWDMDLE